MGGHNSTDGRRRRWRVVGFLVVLVTVCALFTGPAVADGGVTVSREPTEVKVAVQRSAFNATGNQTINVTIGDTLVKSYESNVSGSGWINKTIGVEAFGNTSENVSRDLRAEPVTVIVGNETRTVTVDLRYVEKSGPADMSRGDIVLAVNRSSIVGVPRDASVPVAVSDSDNATRVTATYRAGALRLPLERLPMNLTRFGRLRLRAHPEVSNASWELIPANRARAYVSPRTDAANVSHPLVAAGEDYEVRVMTTNPNGTFSRTLTARGPTDIGGAFSLPESILYAEGLTVRIRTTGDSGRTIYNSSRRSHRALALDGGDRRTVTWNTTEESVALGDAVPGTLNGVWVRQNGSLTRYGADLVADGRLNVTGTAVTPGTEFTVLLVGADESTVVTVLSESESQQNGDGESSDGKTTAGLLKTVADNLGLVLAVGLGALVGLAVSAAGQRTGRFGAPGVVALCAAALVAAFPFGWWVASGLTEYVVFLVAALVVALLTLALALATDLGGRDANPGMFVTGLAVVGVLVFGGWITVELLSDLGGEVWEALRWGLLFGYLGSGTPATVAAFSGTGGDTGGSTSSAVQSGPVEHEATVRITDSTGNAVPGQVVVSFTNRRGQKKRAEIADGSGQVQLPEGTWTAEARHDGQRDRDKQSVQHDRATFGLSFDGHVVALEAVDRDTGDPVAGATVTTDLDGETPGRTDENGRWSATVPLSVDQLQVQVDHDRYEAAGWSPTLDGKESTRLQLRPLVGTVTATVSMDGRGVPEIPVAVTSRSDDERFTESTGSDGTVTFHDVPIGEYTVEPSLAERPSQFSADRASVTVRDGDTERRSFDVRFDYDLDPGTRRQIGQLRDRVDDIAAVSRRDGAIPSYYGSVVHAALDAVESVPDSAYVLLTADVDPDSVVEALLSAAESATTTVDDVMTSKRNVDLFTACSDLPEASVEWGGELSVRRVAELAQQDIGQQRGQVTDRIDAVENRISASVNDVAEVSPAREMKEGVRTMVRDSMGASQVESAALIAVAVALLDAVDSLFDHDQLRRRMERTVY